MASNSTNIHRLQQAINAHGGKILYSTSQFYSTQQNRPVTVYHIKTAVYDEEKERNVNIELFKTTSQIQVVLFLRDMWFEMNGWEVPHDNEMWEKVKEDIKNG